MRLQNLKSLISPNKNKKQLSIGLDWGISALKLVILEPDANTFLLKEAKIIEFSSQGLNPESVIKDLNLPPASGVNLGICGPGVILRYVKTAKMSAGEFKSSLRFEAPQHLPFALEELNLDGVILKDLADNRMLVILAAAKKDFMEKRLKAFQEAGVRVDIVDIDSLALINAFNYTCACGPGNDAASGATALLNIGSCFTSINVLEEGIPHFSRDISIGTRALSGPGLTSESGANFVAEIRKSFDYYEVDSSLFIKKIFLSGGGSRVAGLADNLSAALGISAEPWNPFAKFRICEELKERDRDLAKASAQFAVATGLALR